MDTVAHHHWAFSLLENGVAQLVIDQAGAKVNLLAPEVLAELDDLLARMEREPPLGLVILSGKKTGFIAGADARLFATLGHEDEALIPIRQGQQTLERLARLPFPTVAGIHGPCLGGGLELALACRHRVATTAPATRLGLPEVKLGIHPGFGGTVRLPRLVGDLAALDLMVRGRTLSASEAKRLGLVDLAVSEHQLTEACLGVLTTPALAAGWGRRLPSFWPWRVLTAAVLGPRTRAAAPPAHYPAPQALLDLWRRHGRDETAAALAAEAVSVAHLVTTPTSRHLVRAFFLRERLKEAGRGVESGIRRVHVVGAGVMGGDIAAWCAGRGFVVTLSDTRPATLGAALARARGMFQETLGKEHLVQAAMDRLTPDLDEAGVAKADLVIEAIIEDGEAKRALYGRLEPRLKPGAILASNTSSIPLEELAPALGHPSHLLGLHFFNPVARMPLVEVIQGVGTAPELARRAAAFVRALDRLPLPVQSGPGFLVNRLLMPYLQEAVLLVGEGVAPTLVDRVAREFGMPVGPLKLADAVGLDVVLSVALRLAAGGEVPLLLRELVGLGRLGRKSGQGFYRYDTRGRVVGEGKGGGDAGEVEDRLILPLLNEAMACLRLGVVGDVDLLDGAMIFATGFAPFRGGPMGHAAALGPTRVVWRLNCLAERHGERFRPDAGWGDEALCREIRLQGLGIGARERRDAVPPPARHPAVGGVTP